MAIDTTRVKRTRGGHEVRIYATDGGERYPIHGAMYRDGDWVLLTWDINGHVIGGIFGESDLIEEPRTMELDLWVNVYKDGTTCTWHSKRDAEEATLRNCFARFNIKRTVTEGEGL